MLNAIKIEAGIISVEASAGTAGLFNAIDRLPPFVSMVRDSFMKSATDEAGTPIPSSYSKLAKALAGARYTDLASLTVFTPPGLTIPYLAYLNSLEDAEKCILAISKDVLGPFAFWVARLLTNPTELASARNQLEIPNMELPDLDKLRTQIMKGVVGSNKATEQPYGKMVQRNADWGQIEAKLEELNHHLIAGDRKKIIEQVGDLADNIDKLIARVKEDPEDYQFSEQTLKLFAATCYEVAKVLELYSVYCYQLRLLTVAIEDTQKYLERVVERELKRA